MKKVHLRAMSSQFQSTWQAPSRGLVREEQQSPVAIIETGSCGDLLWRRTLGYANQTLEHIA